MCLMCMGGPDEELHCLSLPHQMWRFPSCVQDRNELSDSGVAELCGYLSKEGGQLLSTERPQPLTLQLNRNFLGVRGTLVGTLQGVRV